MKGNSEMAGRSTVEFLNTATVRRGDGQVRERKIEPSPFLFLGSSWSLDRSTFMGMMYEKEDSMTNVSRRDFLKYIGTGAIGLIAKPKVSFATGEAGFLGSPVIQCFHEDATTGSTINESVVQIMMDESISTLMGIDDVGEAWKSVFSGIASDSVVGIKVNCLFQITTHRELVNCIVNGLGQMRFGGVPYNKNNIIIWDNRDSLLTGNGGYVLYDGNEPDVVRCFGTSHSGIGYASSPLLDVGGVTSKPSRILSEFCDYVVNAAVVKNHSIALATLTMKNSYGSVNNPGSLHGNHCNPYIPSLNQQIRDVLTPSNKQKIFIIDALFGCYSGGPDGTVNFNPKKLIMSLDTVACDWQGQVVINEARLANGLSPLDTPHIRTASQSPYDLGTTDVDLIEINNPTGVEESRTAELNEGRLAVFPNPFSKETTIIFFLPRTSFVYLDLINTAGRLETSIYQGQLPKGKHRIDYRASRGLASGTYFLRLYEQGEARVAKITLLN